jgi:hypothetical protein
MKYQRKVLAMIGAGSQVLREAPPNTGSEEITTGYPFPLSIL